MGAGPARSRNRRPELWFPASRRETATLRVAVVQERFFPGPKAWASSPDSAELVGVPADIERRLLLSGPYGAHGL
jgi:hypothetical protein